MINPDEASELRPVDLEFEVADLLGDHYFFWMLPEERRASGYPVTRDEMLGLVRERWDGTGPVLYWASS